MKRIQIILTLSYFFITHFICAQDKVGLTVKEINYGESKAKKLYEIKMKQSPSGHHNVTAPELEITNRTDTIVAVLGAQFGVEYELASSKNELASIQITWLFPDGMTNEKGKALKKISYPITKETNSYTYSNYTLEGENEVVKGTWTFIISKKGKELYRRDFFLK